MYLVVAAHGTLAESLIASARMVTGYAGDDIFALNMTPDKDMNALIAEAIELIGRDPNGEYMILADLFGASPCNSCLAAFRNTSYRMVTGANMPLLIQAMLMKDGMELEELWKDLAETGRDAIRDIYLRPQE